MLSSSCQLLSRSLDVRMAHTPMKRTTQSQFGHCSYVSFDLASNLAAQLLLACCRATLRAQPIWLRYNRRGGRSLQRETLACFVPPLSTGATPFWYDLPSRTLEPSLPRLDILVRADTRYQTCLFRTLDRANFTAIEMPRHPELDTQLPNLYRLRAQAATLCRRVAAQ